jgi:hypothetical protein
MTRTMISRRTVLRGLGTAMALPVLEAMRPVLAHAAAATIDAPNKPLRMAFLSVPNGIHMPDWTPKSEGYDFDLPFILAPLKNVKDDVLVLTGLTHDKGRANADGPGDHARSAASFLTGCQPVKTAGANIRVGVSVDQFAAKRVGHYTKFPSLEIGLEPGRGAGSCDSGYSCAYSNTISWSSESTPVAKEVNPRLVFERLFSNRPTGPGGESAAKRNLYKSSVLDLVSEDAKRLHGQLGQADRRKLDEYLGGVRELEQRIAQAEKDATANLPDLNIPPGIPQDYADHARLMSDLLVLAFQTDLTRIATFMLANEGSNRSYRPIGVPEGHHDLSHHGGDAAKHAKLRMINRFHVTQLAYLLERLKSVRDGDGTLLDNCMIVYGSGIGDGNRHNHDNLPVLVAGRGADTLRTGRHVRYPDETPMANLFVSMLERVGAATERFGDSTGALPNLS